MMMIRLLRGHIFVIRSVLYNTAAGSDALGVDWLRVHGFDNDKVVECIEYIEGR